MSWDRMTRWVVLVAVGLLPVEALAQRGASSSADEDVSAEAEEQATQEDRYPVSGSVGLAYRVNHASLAATKSDSARFGYQRLTISTTASYTIARDLSVTGALIADKALAETSDRAPNLGGSSTRTINATAMRDGTLELAYTLYKIPVVDITLSSSLGVSLPLSKYSQSAGLLFSASPGLAASWSYKGFGAGASIAYYHNINDDPTVQIDCEQAPENCRVSGRDLGDPNALNGFTGDVRASYRIIPALSVSATYLYGNDFTAVVFPDRDEFTSEYAQTGQGASEGYHGTSFGLSYKTPLDWLSVSLSMTTVRFLNTADRKGISNPFFDTCSDSQTELQADCALHSRTRYQLSLTTSI